MSKPKKDAPPEAHLQIEPLQERPRDTDEYASKMLSNGSTITKLQFRFIENFFELEYDGPKAIILAGYQTDNPTRKAKELMSIPAISEEIIRRMTIKREHFHLELNDIEKEMWANGTDYGEDSSPTARVSALSNLMRSHGAFEKETDRKKKAPVVVNIGFDSIYEDDEQEVIENE